MQLVIIYSKK